MLVTEIIPVLYSKSKNRFRVRLIDGADFVLYKKEINKYEIEEGKEISEELFHTLLTDIFIPRAKQRALHLLEKQDRTESGLREKLSKSGYPSEAIDKALDYVKEYGYIDDVRYCSAYIRYKSKSKSKKKIMFELSEKGISKDVINQAVYSEGLEDLFCDRKIIEEYITKMLSKNKEPDDNIKNRIYNHLLRKGFSSEDIQSAMRELLC